MTSATKLAFLRQRFLETAFIKDAAKGYIVAAEFNVTIDPDILQLASECWADHFRQLGHIDAIAGLPDAGNRLVSKLADILRIPVILPTKRAAVTPGSWVNVVSYHNDSFTTGQTQVLSHIGFVKPGMKVLLIDDVIAHGDTAIAAISALQAAGAEVVGLGVMFDKAWQGGLAAIELQTKLKPHSLISITELAGEKIILDT